MFPTVRELIAVWTLPLVRRLLSPVLDRLDELEYLIMTRADDPVSRFNTATNEVASDLRDLRSALAEALGSKETAVTRAVNEVLDRFEGSISALEAMGADRADPTPSTGGPGPSDGGDGIPAGPNAGAVAAEEPDAGEPGSGQVPNETDPGAGTTR